MLTSGTSNATWPWYSPIVQLYNSVGVDFTLKCILFKWKASILSYKMTYSSNCEAFWSLKIFVGISDCQNSDNNTFIKLATGIKNLNPTNHESGAISFPPLLLLFGLAVQPVGPNIGQFTFFIAVMEGGRIRGIWCRGILKNKGLYKCRVKTFNSSRNYCIAAVKEVRLR